jgi:hypothetical protein
MGDVGHRGEAVGYLVADAGHSLGIVCGEIGIARGKAAQQFLIEGRWNVRRGVRQRDHGVRVFGADRLASAADSALKVFVESLQNPYPRHNSVGNDDD